MHSAILLRQQRTASRSSLPSANAASEASDGVDPGSAARLFLPRAAAV